MGSRAVLRIPCYTSLIDMMVMPASSYSPLKLEPAIAQQFTFVSTFCALKQLLHSCVPNSVSIYIHCMYRTGQFPERVHHSVSLLSTALKTLFETLPRGCTLFYIAVCCLYIQCVFVYATISITHLSNCCHLLLEVA